MDSDLKNSAEALFKDLGLNMTTAFTIFARQAVRLHKIPFELAVDENDRIYSGGNKAYWERAMHDYHEGKFTEHEIVEV
jgi:DNA-damage-inducible protein J